MVLISDALYKAGRPMYRLITQPALQVRTRATNNTFHRSLHHLTPRPVAHRSSIHHRQTSLKKNHDVDHPMQKRGLIDWITSVNPLLLKVILGTLAAGSYVLYLSIARAAFMQRRYIQNRLQTPLVLAEPPINLVRKKETKILQKYFSSSPSGPSVIIGPESAGKGLLLKGIFNGRKMSFWQDLKQNPVTNGEEFIVSFITGTGYKLSNQGSMWSSLFGFGGTRTGYTNSEIDTALNVIAESLRQEFERGWPSGVPVICLDDIHRLGTCNDLDLGKGGKVSDVPHFLKFMDWCIHISDSKLAHVVFVTSYSFAHLDLDTHAAFRRRRSMICIDYAENEDVKRFFTEMSSNFEAFQKPLPSEAVDNIVGCIGGNLEDLDRVVTGLTRGDAYFNILRSMLTDSIVQIEDHLESILETASKTTNDAEKYQLFEKFIRFWNLMEILHKDRYVNKRWIVVNIFHHQHTEELENLLQAQLISFVNERFADPISKKPDSIFSLLNSSLDSIALTAGSPKMKMAFGLLLKDEKMMKQRRWVQQQIDLRALRDREDKLIHDRKNTMDEYIQRFGHLEKLVGKESEWVRYLGQDEVDRRKQRILQAEGSLEKQIEEHNNALYTVREEINKKMTEDTRALPS
ncbi:hypothetical protein PROFUN_04193 [Planoprotostelium fungivorum]|uniref:ATPase domain-containing protein n=1 Tax=Planoprotostelium fungivorum TaxID=1890364 RepID=A0A2P6NVW5_9EUKA|nr:hypothetical protein PROFUN_04193 [Planoprotostelium fungivorum]